MHLRGRGAGGGGLVTGETGAEDLLEARAASVGTVADAAQAGGGIGLEVLARVLAVGQLGCAPEGESQGASVAVEEGLGFC
jgi:hypothetical protein